MRQFDDFYRSEFPVVYRSTYAFCGDKELALDSVQEAFSRALARWRRLQSHPWAGGWVTTTAFNLCRKHLGRKSPTYNPQDLGEAPGSVERLDIVDALRALPPKQRQAIILFYLADLPLAAVADLMNISDGAVKSHLSRARAALRGSLEVADA